MRRPAHPERCGRRAAAARRPVLRGVPSAPLACLLLAAAVHAGSPADAMRRGRAAYTRGQYEEAAKLFRQAADAASAGTLDPAPAALNEGLAEFRQGRTAEAEARFRDALRTSSPVWQAAAYFNLGNLAADQARKEREQQKGQAAREQLQRALAAYENALLLRPEDVDAKVNLELAQRRTDELDALVRQAREALEAADRKVDAADFRGAAEALARFPSAHELVFDLQPDLKKRFEGLSQRVPQIVGILDEVEKTK